MITNRRMRLRPNRPTTRDATGGDGSDLIEWRRRLLLRAGFAPPLAAYAAGECGFDVHALIELVERGCPPDLAVRILAPLDRRPC